MAKKQQIDLNTVITIGAGVIVVWSLVGVKKFLNLLNITQSQETINADKDAANPYSPWNPGFYEKGPAGQKILKISTCEWLYNQWEKSWGVFDDDEETIKGSIKQVIKTQSQWSFMSWWMNRYKNKDLMDYLRGGSFWDRLEDSDIEEISKYIKSLPKYK